MNESAIATPGVYISEISVLPPSVAQVSTAIPAFIGYTEKAVDEQGNALVGIIPVKIFNLKEYEQRFGKAENEKNITVDVTLTTTPSVSVTAVAKLSAAPNPHNMYYALRLYFDNGGGPCYIVSVKPSSTVGILDTDLEKGIQALEAFDEPTLYVIPEGQVIATMSTYHALMQKAVSQCAKLQDRFTLIDVVNNTAVDTNSNINTFRTTAGLDKDLSYAAAYYPNLKTSYEYQYLENTVKIKLVKNGAAAVNTFLNALLPNESVAYYAARDAIKKTLNPVLPPTPAIAGVIASTDANRGVWKAPANVPLSSVFDVTDFITDAEQATMNIDPGIGKSVNAIRPFNGKGILVWGARTLDGNSSEWKYVSVRRFFIMVEESAKKATVQFVFEPNDANTWTKVRAMIENYLTLLWRQGALAGAKPEHAFFVKCGLGQTMTSQDVLDGKLIVEIGMAAVRPAEFIILRFMHKLQES
ncbi:phage tail sheath subtilisin-like domain-containing protein [Solitalea sp. MAHUQ-68]|uniref:Phage tail sheath subtilisin-like domain-containing protein n=1 Tax=Solitalea agri TaxID=2953739 RepID=A0A9X2F581_9SPHI|nr:phage tail sheath C-terminal domain-containing protein [Solitalea agri]MCO4294450.1 phage tail sheath subtilisin-like domain-containing protein [Solitalea agri]